MRITDSEDRKKVIELYKIANDETIKRANIINKESMEMVESAKRALILIEEMQEELDKIKNRTIQ